MLEEKSIPAKTKTYQLVSIHLGGKEHPCRNKNISTSLNFEIERTLRSGKTKYWKYHFNSSYSDLGHIQTHPKAPQIKNNNHK